MTPQAQKLKKALQEQGFNIYDLAVMTADTREEIICTPCNRLNNSYSIAKLFINTIIGMLETEGRLKLDDFITDILRPELKFSYNSIWDTATLRHALSHSLGLTHGCFDVDRDDPQSYGTEDYLYYIFSHPPAKSPGTFHLYTDCAHYLLSRIITQITGHPADEIIQTRICNPLQFYPSAWQRCPRGCTIGSSGAFLRSQDLVKLGWLYMNHGIYENQRLLPEDWIKAAEKEQFDLYPLRGTGGFIGKAGICGQMLAYSRSLEIAVCWHGFETREKNLRSFILEAIHSIYQN